MKTNTQHTLIPEDGKRHPEAADSSACDQRASPLHIALAAVADYGRQGPGVDLDTYLMAIDAGWSHGDALLIAKTAFEDCMA